MFDPTKIVSDAAAEAQQAEAKAVGFFSRPVPMWWLGVAAVAGLLVGLVL